MSDSYLPKLSKLEGNTIFAEDGTVWLNYEIEGINVNPYSSEITRYQDAHERFFYALSTLPSDDFLLLGFKARSDPWDIMQKCMKGLDGKKWKANEYPVLKQLYSGLYSRLLSGEFVEHKRKFWLSIGVPFTRSALERTFSSMAVTDPHADLNIHDVESFHQRVMVALAEFNPKATTPEHVKWIHRRARYRGVETPVWNESQMKNAPAVRMSPKSFSPVDYDFAQDQSLLWEDFVEKMGKQDSSLMKRARKVFDGRYGRTVKSNTISLSNSDDVEDGMPKGVTSYQSFLAVNGYPNGPTTDLNSFTYLVDGFIGIDADVALRFKFNKDLVSRKLLSKAIGNLHSESDANSKNELEMRDYDRKKEQMYQWHELVRTEANSMPMQVTAIFAFGDANIDRLRSRVESVRTQLASKFFETTYTKGGQKQLFEMTMPGSATTQLGWNLAGDTTVRTFSAFMPMRISRAGDEYGLPIFRNRENALGQFVYRDILHSTDRGNASMEFTGAQGSGKTNILKYLEAGLYGFGGTAYVIDQSEHGEYEVFSRALPGATPQIVDLTGRKRRASLDIIKVFPEEKVPQVFLDSWLPLMGLDKFSEEADILTEVLSPQYRDMFRTSIRPVDSTYQLIRHLKDYPGAESLVRMLTFWAKQPYAAAFIDPEEFGDVVDIPPFTPHSRIVVFRTTGLTMYQGEDWSKATTSQQFAAMALTVVAALTKEQFMSIKETAALIGDEMHFLSGTDVLVPLIKEKDRTGRKANKCVWVGSQLAGDQDENYALINARTALRQESEENAVPALKRVGLPPVRSIVDWMVTDTSPKDASNNNYVRWNRHGEGWFNDGAGNIIRIQTMPQLLESLRIGGDTTSSKMIRADELDPR